MGCAYRVEIDMSGESGYCMIDEGPARLLVEGGWPLRTWSSRSDGYPAFTDRRLVPDGAGAMVFSSFGNAGGTIRRGVPLRPIAWPLLGLSAPFALWPLALMGVRVRRGREKRCLSCGYEAAPLPVCPECGSDQSRKRQRPGTAAIADPTLTG